MFAIAHPVIAQERAAPIWRIELRIEDTTALDLSVCSESAQAQVRFHTGDRDATAPLRLTRSGGGAIVPGAARATYEARGWKAGESLQARVDAAAARAGTRVRAAAAPVLLLDPRQWLWRPTSLSPDSTIRFVLPPGWSASVPWTPLPHARQTYRLGAIAADWPALTAFGPFTEQRLQRKGGVLRVAILPPWREADLDRIAPVADALVQAYGRLPRADAQVLVQPLPGSREAMPWGEAMRGGGSAVHLYPGADAARDAPIRDWTATHEFAHLLHPHLGTRGRWLSEGLASYYQHVLRARIGRLTADEAWAAIAAGFERGRRERRSDGLTLAEASRRMREQRAYLRSYWSGAAYWLETDLALRAQASSLDAVLRRYAECCLTRIVQTSPEAFVAALARDAPQAGLDARLTAYLALTGFPAVAIPAPDDARRDAIMRPWTEPVTHAP